VDSDDLHDHFYLEATTLENGCTWLVPGSHHFPGVNGKIGETDWAQSIAEQAVPLPMPAGGMVLIDSMVMHRAGQNTTDDTRMSMTIGYHSVDEISDVPNPKRILVRGEDAYSGNDKQRA
jgi:phytanoyl-CoA hydroxylase